MTASPTPPVDLEALAGLLGERDDILRGNFFDDFRTKSERMGEIEVQVFNALPALLAALDRDALMAAILATRWPNGDLLDGVTTRTAGMIADSIRTALTPKEPDHDHA